MQIKAREGPGLVLVGDLQLVALDEVDVIPGIIGHLAAAQTKLPGRIGRRSELIVEPQPSRTRLVGFVRQLQIYPLGVRVIDDGQGIEVLSGLNRVDMRRKRRAIFRRLGDLPNLRLARKVDAEELR